MIQSEKEICGLNGEYYFKQNSAGKLDVLKSMLEIVVANMEFLEVEIQQLSAETSAQADNKLQAKICSDSPCAYCTESGNGCCDKCGVQTQKYYFRGRKLSAV